MEIMSIYQIVSSSVYMLGLDIQTSLWLGLGFGIVVWLTLFILQGIGLSTMAKNKGIKKRWLAFVPFANVFLIGKIAGDGDVFGKRVKNLKLYVCISEIIATVICFSTVAAEMYLYLTYGAPTRSDFETPYWPGLTGMAFTISRFYEFSNFLISIFGLVFEILMFLLVLGIFKNYTPENYNFLGLLTLFVPISRYIIIFALRKRKMVDFDAYMRAKREAFFKRQQQYQNRYGNPYNPYAGYNPNQGQTPPQEPKKPEEPFEEFTSDKKSNDGNDGNKKDEFFN